MAIDFPNSPVLNQVFEANGRYWQWDGTSWNAYYNQAAAEKHGLSHSAGGTDPINISQSQVSNLTTDLGNKAPIASPTFTGTVTAPTLSSTTANITTGNITNLTASTSAALPANTTIGVVSPTELTYLDGVTSAIQTQLNAKANTASPTLTGTPAAPTAATGTNTTQIATTAFVQTAVSPFTGRNRIINGDFSIWQRGTTFSNPANGTYTADRWLLQVDGSGATRTISQQSFTAGNPIAGYEPTYFLRYNQSVAGTSATFNIIDQRIEDVRTFAGQTVTVSFWAKAAANTTVSSHINQVFGTGGSPEVQATTTQNFTVTTSWQRFFYTASLASISGKTIGPNNFMFLRFNFPLNATFVVDIWGVQLEAGSIATPFEIKPYADQLRDCQRYYEKSYSTETAPGTSGRNGAVSIGTYFNGANSYNNSVGFRFKVSKRATPVVTGYDPDAGTINKGLYDAPNTAATQGDINFVSINSEGVASVTVACSGRTQGQPTSLIFHYTASAEL